MELMYFGEIDCSSIEDYYDKEISINGKDIEIDINFEESSTDEETLTIVNEQLLKIEDNIEKSMFLIGQDYDLGEESETAIDYVNHHIDILDEKEVVALFGSKNVSRENLLSALVVQRVGFYPEDDESFMLIDITLKGDVTNYLMSVTYGKDGELSYISMES